MATLKTDILILGAGIGGFETFRTLSKLLKRHNINKKITIVDENNYFTFVPMLHEVATGSIEPTHCAIPLRELIYKTPHEFINARVEYINPEKKQVTTHEGIIDYEFAVIALGSVTNYFNTPGAEQYTHNVRSLISALKLKYELLGQLNNTHKEELNICIVGGGYTGVEIAGQLYDLALREVTQLYPHKKMSITLIHSGDTILNYMPKKVQDKVARRLEKKGVEILLNAKVSKVSNDAVVLADGKTLTSDLTIWTAGFENIGPHYMDPKYCCQKSRIQVTGELTMPDFPHTYALGDNAEILDPHTHIAYPQLAEAAHLEGRYLAHHILRTIHGKKNTRFVFHSKGTLMPVGDWYGVAQIGPFILFGKLAWWIRRTVYVMFMPGFWRKIRIVFDWTVHSFGFRHLINLKSDTDYTD
ncbi:MAG: NAD(P)/FAD-dependent oxidoreductase [Candidatus Magasanikbacteria bacterium]|nr:NAD(P)/FAD-dependent oxidoreductase [Candidatus Magasanikbacteria bacterium]